MQKILLLAGDFTEDYETMVPFQALSMLGYQVDAVCPGKKAGEFIKTAIHDFEGDQTYTEKPGHLFKLTKTFDEVDFDEFDMVVLPGGMPGTLNLKNHDGVRYVVKQYAKEGRYVGAICAAPTILKSLGVLEGRRATCYPGVEDEMEDVVLTETAVVVDENIITSQGVGTAIDFGLKLIEILDSEEKAKEIADSIVF
mgnify:CR=1 FL=1